MEQARDEWVRMSTTTWGAGAYPLMAERLGAAAEAVVDRAEVQPGERVVDIATGTGNAALLAAARGAEVVGVDFEATLLNIAGRRAAEAGLDVRWETADVATLPIPDHWADAVLSVFGVMYAADHDAAAREVARCAAPDARVVLAAWVPGSFMPAMGAALSTLLPPPPPSSGPPSRWGDPDALDALLTSASLRVTSNSIEELSMTFAGSGEATDFLVRTAGHVVSEQVRLTAADRWNDLLTTVQDLVEARSHRAGGQIRLDFEYLLSTAKPA